MRDLAVRQPHLGQESIAALARIAQSQDAGVAQDDIEPFLLVRLLRCGYVQRRQANHPVFIATPAGTARARQEAITAQRREEDQARREIIRGRVQGMIDRLAIDRPIPPPVPSLRDLPGYRERALPPVQAMPVPVIPRRQLPAPAEARVRPPEYRALSSPEDALRAIRENDQRMKQELEGFVAGGLSSAGSGDPPVVHVGRLPARHEAGGPDALAGEDTVPVLGPLADALFEPSATHDEDPQQGRTRSGKGWRGGAATVVVAGGVLLVAGTLFWRYELPSGSTQVAFNPAHEALPRVAIAQASPVAARDTAAGVLKPPPQPAAVEHLASAEHVAAAEHLVAAPATAPVQVPKVMSRAPATVAAAPVHEPAVMAPAHRAAVAVPVRERAASAHQPQTPAPEQTASVQQPATPIHPRPPVPEQTTVQEHVASHGLVAASSVQIAAGGTVAAHGNPVAQSGPAPLSLPRVAVARPASPPGQRTGSGQLPAGTAASNVAKPTIVAAQPASTLPVLGPPAVVSTALPIVGMSSPRPEPGAFPTPVAQHPDVADQAAPAADHASVRGPVARRATPASPESAAVPPPIVTAHTSPAAPVHAAKAAPVQIFHSVADDALVEAAVTAVPLSPPVRPVAGQGKAGQKPVHAASSTPHATRVATIARTPPPAIPDSAPSRPAPVRTAALNPLPEPPPAAAPQPAAMPEREALAEVIDRLRAGKYSDNAAVEVLNTLSLRAAMAGRTFTPIADADGKQAAHARPTVQSAATDDTVF